MTQLTMGFLTFVHAHNWRTYGIGRQLRNGFHVRKVVWGMLMAREEKRDGETIKRCKVMVERKVDKRRRKKT